jgi:hypothetical protein
MGNYSHGVYYNRFQSFTDALRRAGLEPNHQFDVSREDVLNDIEEVASKLNGTPTTEDMAELGEYEGAAYSRHFDSFAEALETAGMEPARRTDYNHEDLIEDIRQTASDIGRTPSIQDMREHGKYSPNTHWRTFGGWNAAVVKAGLTPRWTPLSRKELTDELQRLYEELGTLPTKPVMRDKGEYAVNTYYNHFGSWTAALDKSGLPTDELSAYLSDPNGYTTHWIYNMVLRGLPGPRWEDVSEQVRDDSLGDCLACEEAVGRDGIVAHHIPSILGGGTNSADTTIPVCASCHRKVEAVTTRVCGRIIEDIAIEESEWESDQPHTEVPLSLWTHPA